MLNKFKTSINMNEFSNLTDEPEPINDTLLTVLNIIFTVIYSILTIILTFITYKVF